MLEGRVRPFIAALPPTETGAAAVAELMKQGRTQFVRLNSNEGPLPPFTEALQAMAEAAVQLNRYPHPTGQPLAIALAQQHGLAPEQVVVDAGTTPLLYLLALALLEPGDELVYPWPSFPLYATAALRAQARPVPVELKSQVVDPIAMSAAITPRSKLLVVCNPNNPTGTMVGSAAIDNLIDLAPSDAVVVLDEAYAEYAPSFPDGFGHVRDGRSVVVLRTFSKIYGLAGARVGMAAGPTWLMDSVRKLQTPFPVSHMALAAALASLPLQDQVQARARANQQERERMIRALREQGLECVPSVTNFFLVRVGSGAAEVQRRLAMEGVLVRSGRGYDLPDYVRVTVGLPEETDAFLAALPAALAP